LTLAQFVRHLVRMILGIDPGAGGALAVVSGGSVVAVWDMPTVEVRSKRGTKRRVDPVALAAIVRECGACSGVVELVGSRPGEGHVGAFSFGKAAGFAEMAVAAAGIPYTLVPPASWKAALRVPADKDAARLRASQLMPKAAKHWPLKKHDGRAEAALLALWGERQNLTYQQIEW
jgi:crossover junction endodeoxyribonuclease RuvC